MKRITEFRFGNVSVDFSEDEQVIVQDDDVKLDVDTEVFKQICIQYLCLECPDVIKFDGDNEEVTTETPEEKEALDAIEPKVAEGLEVVGGKVGLEIHEDFRDEVEKVEWKNGDELYHTHHAYAPNPKITYVGKHPFISGKSYCISDMDGIVTVDDCFISDKKPETKAKKLEREREMAVYDMCSSLDNHAEEARFWAERFYDAGYRKGE